MKKHLVIILALLFIVVDISVIIFTKDINNTVSKYEDEKKDYAGSDLVKSGMGNGTTDGSSSGIEDDSGPKIERIDTVPAIIANDNGVTCPKAKFGFSVDGLELNQTYFDVSEEDSFPATTSLFSAPISDYTLLANYKCDAGEVETGLLPFVYDDLTISSTNKNGVVVLDESIYSYVLDYLTANLGEDDVKDAKVGEVTIGDKTCIKLNYLVGENVYHVYAISYGKNFFVVIGVIPATSSADIETPMRGIVESLTVAN